VSVLIRPFSWSNKSGAFCWFSPGLFCSLVADVMWNMDLGVRPPWLAFLFHSRLHITWCCNMWFDCIMLKTAGSLLLCVCILLKFGFFLLSLASILSTAIVEWMLQSLESIPVSCLVAFCVHLDLCPSSWRLAICCLCCLHPICYVSVQLEQSFWLPCSLALCHHPHQVSVVRTTDMCPEIKKLVPLINKSIDQTSEIWLFTLFY
jgi:hypothetical protein